jgi:hypothetical protein
MGRRDCSLWRSSRRANAIEVTLLQFGRRDFLPSAARFFAERKMIMGEKIVTSSRTITITAATRFNGFVGNDYSLPLNIENFLADTLYTVENGMLEIHTPDGIMQVKPGYALIKDQNGDVFAMSPEVVKQFQQ